MTKDMTQGSPLKNIVLFSLPVLAGNLFQQLYNMVDAVIVGRVLGPDALAAVGATGCLMFLVLGFANGIAQGFSVMIAQAFGAGNHRQLKHYVALIVVLSIIVSVLLSIPTAMNAKWLLELLETPSDVIDMSTSYIEVIFAGIILTMAYNVEAGILRGVGDSRTPLYFLFLASIINVILDIVFIMVLGFGTEGAAYATVIGQGVSAVCCFVYMFVKFPIIKVSKEDFYWDIRACVNLLRLGIPMAINYSITAIGTMIFQRAINVFGSSIMASYTAASKVVNLTTQTMPALGTATATFCGQNLGAGKYDRIYKGMRVSLFICIVIGLLAGAISILAGPAMVSIFIDKPDARTMEDAMTYLWRASLFMIPLAMIFAYRNGMQGLNRSFVPMLSGIVELFSRFAVVKLLSGPYGYKGVCWTDAICWGMTGVIVWVAYLCWEMKSRRRHMSGQALSLEKNKS